MKRIVSEDQVSAESVKGTEERGSIPQAGVYIPSYKGVNQVLYQASGSGEISFGNALAKSSIRAMQAQQELYDRIEVSRSVGEVDKQFHAEYETFLETNETGQGLMEFSTGKYQELSDVAISNASNAEVQNNLRAIFEYRKNDIANSSFKKEKETYAGYALNKITTDSNSTLNEIISNPDQIRSLSVKYESQISGMQGIVSAVEFEKYKTNCIHNLAKAYGIGLIKKDPYRAKEMLSGEYFTKSLSPDEYTGLLAHADREISHRESKELQRQALAKRSMAELERLSTSELTLGFVDGTKSNVDVYKYFETGRISEITKNHLLEKYIKVKNKQKDNFDVSQEISEHLKNNTPAPLIESGKKKEYFMNSIRNQNDIREGEGKPQLSLTEIVEYAKENAIVFDSNVAPVKNACVTSIMNGKDAKTVMDACIAVKDNENVPAIKGIDKDVVFFASFAVDHYDGTNNINDLLDFRDKFLAPQDEKTLSYRTNQWKQEKYSTNKDSELDAFLKRNKFATDEGLFWNSIPATVKNEFRQKAYDILKHVYMKTSSISIAESVASNVLSNNFGDTEINGQKERMYNPPTKINTKYSDVAISNFVADKGQRIIKSIEDAGDNYKGYIPVRRISRHDFMKNMKDIQKADFYTKDFVKDKHRKIQVKINDKWEERSLRIEATPLNNTAYSYYFLLDESDALSKEYIINPATGKRAVIDFSTIKAKQ